MGVCSQAWLFNLSAVGLNSGPQIVQESLSECYSLSHAPRLCDPSRVLFCVKCLCRRLIPLHFVSVCWGTVG